MTLAEYWEWFGVAMALIYVFLASKIKRSCFVFGFISSLVFLEISFSAKLYFETIIYAYYLVMSIVGWLTWKPDHGKIIPFSISSRSFVLLFSIGFVISIIIGYASFSYSDASLPFVDSFTTVMAILATWLMVKKIIQNWIIWIIADSVSIFMYFYKDLEVISGLFVIYTLMAVFGYFNWRKKMLDV